MSVIDKNDPIRLTKAMIYIATGIATVALFTGAALQGLWRLAIPVAVLGALGILAAVKDWGRPLGAVGFAGFVILAGVAVLQQAHPLWSLVGVTAALGAWDLQAFRARLASVELVANPEALLRHHLGRLGIVALLGLSLGTAALFVRIDYGIGVVVALAFLMAVGLGQVVSQLRRDSD